MATYTGAIICSGFTTQRINERPGCFVSVMPATYAGKSVKAFMPTILNTAPAEVQNSKDEKVGILVSAMPMQKAGGSTTIVRGAKYPRTSPLEVCWTKINK